MPRSTRFVDDLVEIEPPRRVLAVGQQHHHLPIAIGAITCGALLIANRDEHGFIQRRGAGRRQFRERPFGLRMIGAHRVWDRHMVVEGHHLDERVRGSCSMSAVAAAVARSSRPPCMLWLLSTSRVIASGTRSPWENITIC